MRWSVHLFASRKAWLILIRWSWRRRNLRSLSREEYELLGDLLDWTRSIMTLASISTMSWAMPSYFANIRLSLKAHNSAVMLVANPMRLINPLIHFPWWSRTKPPPLALLGFPRDAPSVFNLYHPGGSLIQHTGVAIRCLNFWPFPTQKKYSLATYMHIWWSFRLIGVLSKVTQLLCFHKDQMASGNWIHQGIPFALIWELHKLFSFSQSRRSRQRKLAKTWGTPMHQNFLVTGQFLRAWMMDSSYLWHKGQLVLQFIPPVLSTCLTRILPWWQSQRKCLIFGSVSSP